MSSLPFWQNIMDLSKYSMDDQQSLFEKNSPGSSDPENKNCPSKRWGHTSVEALNRMFIIGGYQGKCNSYNSPSYRSISWRHMDV